MRRAPASPAASITRSMAPRCPATTTWVVELWRAISTISPRDCSRQMPSRVPASSPTTAAMPPTPAGTAACIAFPRMRTRRTASENPRLPAATSAEYSPREWPAATRGWTWGRSLARTRRRATDRVKIAGCAFSVSVRVSMGPSLIKEARSSPRASLASSKVESATSWSAHKPTPIPTYWLP